MWVTGGAVDFACVLEASIRTYIGVSCVQMDSHACYRCCGGLCMGVTGALKDLASRITHSSHHHQTLTAG